MKAFILRNYSNRKTPHLPIWGALARLWRGYSCRSLAIKSLSRYLRPKGELHPPIWGAWGVVLLFACSSEPPVSNIDFEPLSASKTVSLTKDADSPECKISLEVLAAKGNGKAEQAINKAIVAKLFDFTNLSPRAAVDSFARKYTSDYVENMSPLYKDDRGDESKKPWYQYSYDVKTKVEDGREGVSVYTINLSYYEGGAHGIDHTLTMNFDKKTGKQLTLADVFVAGYQQNLNEKLIDALLKKVGVNTVNELHDKDYLYSTDMFPSENFILGEDEITFIYNPYEIAPYEKGKTELTIDYDDLADIMPKQ